MAARILKYFYSVTLIVSLGCQSSDKTPQGPDTQKSSSLIRSEYKKGEITRLCDEAIQSTDHRLKAIENLPKAERNIDNTLIEFENASADFTDLSQPLEFMSYVGMEESIAKEASDCEEKNAKFLTDVSSRKGLYEAIASGKPRNAEEARLLEKTKEDFERSGILLSSEALKQLTALTTELKVKESQYSTNLNTDNTSITFTEAELDGVTADSFARFKKNEKGEFIVTTKTTDYVAVIEHAKNPTTRERVARAYLSRGGETNLKLLQEAAALRQQMATALGYKTWLDFKTANRSAKNAATVQSFLGNLRNKLKARQKQDFAQLLKFKKELDPKATGLNAWDLAYLSYNLKKKDYQIDEEKIREYFPAEQTVQGVFAVYAELLGVRFDEVKDAKVWSPQVKLYEVRDSASNELMGYFYTDFYPRQGKYGHAAAFTLKLGRIVQGERAKPISAIVTNFTPPTNDKPSLLSHDEVETFFHEFGHIMHKTLTRARYGTFAGSAVPRDFVEAPSQMLENWAWNKVILQKISGHYLRPSEKLPDDMIEKMLRTRDFQQGTQYMRQLLFASFDMNLHSGKKNVQPGQLYDSLYLELLGIKPIAGNLFPANFGHMMGGYDAGYYGYLWSKVYAQDMFSLFDKAGPLNHDVGMKYRKEILEVGHTRDVSQSLKAFLGREPNSKAFFKLLKIN